VLDPVFPPTRFAGAGDHVVLEFLVSVEGARG
jgi:hypothetical protein